MSDHPEHPDAQHSPIKTPKQLIVVVVLAFIVPVVLLILLANMAGSVGGHNAGSNARTPEATAERIAPVARHEVNQAGAGASSPVPGAPALAQAAPAPTAVAAAAPAGAPPGAAGGGGSAGGAAIGEKLYKSTCVACHGAGIAGAPKFGDKATWAPYIATGMDTMVAVAIKGKGAMPPKGGAVSASDDDIRAAVQYMVDAAQ